MRAETAPLYFRAMALFYVVFGLITTFYPPLMKLFMTEEGRTATSTFSDQVWLHGGLDILSVALLLFVLAQLPATGLTLRAAAVVALMPTAAILYTFLATPFWSALFLVPGAAALGFSAYGFLLARSLDKARAAEPLTG
jgi:hypothetical protein